LLRHQLFSPVPPVSWLHEDIPEMLENIVHRATRKSPDARFEAMADFKRALDVFAGMDDPPPSRRARDIDLPQEDDVYTPVSHRVGSRVRNLFTTSQSSSASSASASSGCFSTSSGCSASRRILLRFERMTTDPSLVGLTSPGEATGHRV